MKSHDSLEGLTNKPGWLEENTLENKTVITDVLMIWKVIAMGWMLFRTLGRAVLVNKIS